MILIAIAGLCSVLPHEAGLRFNVDLIEHNRVYTSQIDDTPTLGQYIFWDYCDCEGASEKHPCLGRKVVGYRMERKGGELVKIGSNWVFITHTRYEKLARPLWVTAKNFLKTETLYDPEVKDLDVHGDREDRRIHR